MWQRSMAAVAALCISALAFAQGGAPAPGIDYQELRPPQSTESPGKVELIEFFWYRCPHCYALEPMLVEYVKRLPPDTQFRRVPGIFNDDWAIDGRIFYALEATGDLERVHKGLFDAIHQTGGVRLKGDAYARWVADWLSKNGVDMKKYDAAYNSFGVQTKVNRARQMTAAYKLDGVPALAVQGKYLVSASVGERKLMLAITDYLIGQARRELKK